MKQKLSISWEFLKITNPFDKYTCNKNDMKQIFWEAQKLTLKLTGQAVLDQNMQNCFDHLPVLRNHLATAGKNALFPGNSIKISLQYC